MGRSMSLHLKSSTSMYWKTHRRDLYNSRDVYNAEAKREYLEEFLTMNDPDTPIQEMNPRECMHHALENLDFYHKALLTDYYINKMTFYKMHLKYGITLDNLRKDVKNGVKLIQKHCKHFI